MAQSRFVVGDFQQFLLEPVSLNGVPQWKLEWLIENLLQRNAFNILGGAQKVGKSLLRSHLLISAIAECPALSVFKTRKARKALLLAGEERPEVEQARFFRAAKGLKVKADILPIYILPQQHGFFFDDYKSFSAFLEFLQEERFDLVVIDPLIRWHRVNENVAGELAPILTNLRLITEFATLLVVHHTGKPREGSEDMLPGHLLRGSSDLAAIYDHLIIMKNAPGAGKLTKKLIIDTRYDTTPPPLTIDLEFSKMAYSCVLRQSLREAAQILLGQSALSRNQLAKELKRGRDQVGEVLETLAAEGIIEHGEDGWSLINGPNARS